MLRSSAHPAAFLFCGLIAAALAVKGQQRPCSKPTYEHNDNAYDFDRSSTITSDKEHDTNIVEHCIETLNGKAIPANWLGPRLGGWALPERPLRSQNPSESATGIPTDSTLTYGVAQTTIRAPYLEVQYPKKPSPDNSFAPLVSHFQLAVGSQGKESANFVAIDAEFVSQVTPIVKGEYLYLYTWRNRGTIQRLQSSADGTLKITDTIPSVPFLLKSSSVADAWAQTGKGAERRNEYYLQPLAQSVFVSYKEAPEPRVVDIEFFAADRETRVGHASVVIYSPKGAPPVRR